MATRTSAASGDWSVGATWGGVAPVLGDKVYIASGHTVTVDNTSCAGGDDTSTAINVQSGGTLKWSRTADSTLTVRGELLILTGGTYDMGTSGGPIPQAYTATLIANDSASPSNAKWGVTFQDGTGLWIYGAAKKTNTYLLAGISAGATSCDVADATGWQVGDRVVLANTGNTHSQEDLITITSLTLISGTSYTVGWTGGTTYAHAIDAPVGNLTNNCIITVSNTTYRSYFDAMSNTSQTANSREIRYVTFKDFAQTGLTSNEKYAGLSLRTTSQGVSTLPYISIGNIVFDQPSLGAQGYLRCFTHSARYVIRDIAVYVNSTFFLNHGGSTFDMHDVYVYRASVAISHGFSDGSRNPRYYDCHFSNCTAYVINIGGTNYPEFHRCKFYSSNYMGALSVGSNHQFFDCDFGGAGVPGGGRFTQSYFWVGATAPALVSLLKSNCRFSSAMSTMTANVTNWFNGLSVSNIHVVNKDDSVTSQEKHYPGASFYRNNSVATRSLSSLELENTDVTHAFSFQPIYIPAVDAVPITVVGYLRKNSTYGSSNRPTVTLSGLDITPQTFTMTDSTDTWEKFTFTVTPAAGYNGNLELVYTGWSANTAGRSYLSGVITGDAFIGYVDHYGYTYDPTNNARTVDSVITETTEATVAAYTGISISGGVITMTSDHSIEELYDYCQLYRVDNLVAPFFESTDGVNFTCTYDLTLNNCDLTGSGVINMQGNTLTLTGTTTSGVVINHDAGSYTLISVTGIVSGSRIRLSNTTDATEIANEIVSGTTFSKNFSFTTSKNIRLDLTYVSGLTAYETYTSNNTIAASGVSFLAAQVSDAVYAANAINGSTVTEFAADYPNVQVDIDDADEATTVQRLYAWFKYTENTEDGIRFFIGGMTAEDEVNYAIDPTIIDLLLDNVAATPVIISGARLYRTDGTTVIFSSSGAIQIDPDKAYLANGDEILKNVKLSVALSA